jgi:hypothetical protein
MKTQSIKRTAYTGCFASILALGAGCAATPAGADGDVGEESAEALSRCGPTPPRMPCVAWVCDSTGSWDDRPSAKGTACHTVHGNGTCDGDEMCSSDKLITGTLFPHYYVISVMYAPPGTSSNVDYGQGSSLGSTTSASSTFNSSTTVTVASSGNAVVGGGGFSVSATASGTQGSSASYDVKETTQTDFIVNGFQDAINHDLDRIYLWLNPQVNISAYGDDVSWTITARQGQTPLLQYVNVLWLRQPSTMPSDVAALLASAGITSADYAQILKADPLATGGALDPNRYKLQTELPYEPVAVKGQNPTATKYALSKTMNQSWANTASTSYSVKMEASGGVDFFGLLSAKLTVADSFTWTQSNGFSSTQGSTVSASASIVQPAFEYTGPTALNVYLDTVFNTFVFSFQ